MKPGPLCKDDRLKPHNCRKVKGVPPIRIALALLNIIDPMQGAIEENRKLFLCKVMEDVAVKVAEVEQRARSNTRRIDKLEERQDNLDSLVASVSLLASEQEHIKDDVTEIKTDVKALTEKPGKRWESVVEKVVLLVVAGVVGFLLAQIGFA